MTENLKLKHDWKTLMSYWKLKPMTENLNPWLKTQTHDWKLKPMNEKPQEE